MVSVSLDGYIKIITLSHFGPFFLSGCNFGHVNVTQSDGIFVEATLNGAILDTDVVPITEKPVFDSELMWELDKKMLKR